MLTKTLPVSKTLVPSMETATFLWLLRFAFICFSIVWAIDYTSGIIVPFDKVAYPICMTMFLFIYIATKQYWLQEENAHLCAYCVVAGFLTASSIWHHMTPMGPYFNAAQWLGLNYVMAYLFLDVRKAAMTTIAVMLFTLIGHYLAVREHRDIADSLGIVLNMGIAHMIYVVLLWTVLKMRVRAAEAHERLNLLEQHALIDPLTRVLNRRGLEDILHQVDSNPPPLFGMILIDIDHFKTINDQYGHTTGDTVLRGVAETLQRAIRNHDNLGRWGGEEFLLITAGQSYQEVLEIAEGLRSAVQNEAYLENRTVTISLGVSFSDQAGQMDELFNIADMNLYSAKQQGRNRVISTAKQPTKEATTVVSPSLI